MLQACQFIVTLLTCKLIGLSYILKRLIYGSLLYKYLIVDVKSQNVSIVYLNLPGQMIQIYNIQNYRLL